ncbi:MAG: TVP38/TMEM64 family protein [Desulfobulbaceae bacterium]|nr:TVP38/TMEM64 family protein [Desulfobulbaceae bacterium]
MSEENSAKKGAGKAVMFVLFIVAAVIIFRYTPISEWIDPQRLRELVESFGVWSPLVFILIYAVGICFFLPATLFTGLGALLFGTMYGFIYNEIGAMLGASAAFYIGRYLGRDYVSSLIGDRLQKYDDKIAANGFTTTLYLRLLFMPFSLFNFGLGLTRVTFREYFFGTLFGIIVGGFVFTFFFATVIDVWASGDWGQLLGWKTLLSLVLFGASFQIPRVVKKLKPEV